MGIVMVRLDVKLIQTIRRILSRVKPDPTNPSDHTMLVNRNSYSAAEFLAAQLQESAGAVVAGEQTSGKGFSQVLFDLPDGSAIGLSTARYYTGGGVSLIGTGLTPDPLCSLSEEDEQKLLAGQLEPQEDEQLQAAIQAMEK